MASSDQVEARGPSARLGVGKWKVEAIVVPELPAIMSADAECVVLSCEMVRLPDTSRRLSGPHGHAVTVTDVRFGLVVVIATPEVGE